MPVVRNLLRLIQKGLKCTKCKQWLHISCAGIPCQIYDDLSDSFENWQCNICLFKQLPFHYVASVVESKSYDKPHSSYTPVSSRSKLVYKACNGNCLNIAQLIIIIIITFIGRLIRAFLSAQVVCLTEYHLFTHVYNFIQ